MDSADHPAHRRRANRTGRSATFSALAKRRTDDAEKAVKEAAAKRNKSSKPSLALDAYAGRYRDPWYGDVVVEKQGDELGIRFTHSKALTGKLEDWQ